MLRGDQVVKATRQHRDRPALRRPLADRLHRLQLLHPRVRPQRPQDPRQAIEGVNVFYDWRTKVDEQDRFVFEDRAGEAPSVRVGRQGPPASRTPARRAATIFNKAIVTGQDANGRPIREIVTSGDPSNVVYEDITGAHLL